MGQYSVTRDLYASVGASAVTSEVYKVADLQEMTMQIVGSPSTTTIQASNDDGRTAAIANWSTLTTVIGAAFINIEPGFRWLRMQRSETTNAILAGRAQI